MKKNYTCTVTKKPNHNKTLFLTNKLGLQRVKKNSGRVGSGHFSKQQYFFGWGIRHTECLVHIVKCYSAKTPKNIKQYINKCGIFQ